MGTTTAMGMGRTRKKRGPDGSRAEPSKRQIGVLRIVVIAAGTAAAGFLAFAVSVVGITRYDQPERALALLPFDAVANSVLADRQLQTSPKDSQEIEALAKRAIERTPLAPTAMRVLGFVADGRGEAGLASRRIKYAVALSRRDLPANLWLVEEAVRRNDVRTTLDRYDVALRTSRLAAPVLFPVLANALTDAEFVAPVTALLRRNPPWITEFVPWAIHQGGASENITLVLEGLPALSKDRDSQLAIAAVGQLVGEQRFTTAARFLDSPLARSAGASGSTQTRTLSALGTQGAIPPFAWSLVQNPDLGAEVEEGAISVYAKDGASGIVASRLLVLAPGSYRLTTSGSGAIAVGDVRWTLNCGTNPERLVADLAIPAAPAPVYRDFVVDDTCAGQWLRLVVRNSSADSELTAKVATVSLARIARS